MKLNELPKITTKKKKVIGRGSGSGKGGHTVGRGHKGQKARGKIPLTFTGTKMKKSLLKRLPLQRGKGKLKTLKQKPIIVNLKYLGLFKKGETVNLNSLIKKGIVKEKEVKKFGVKILGEGKIEIPLKVALPCSQKAAKKIEKAGGEIVKEIRNSKRKVREKKRKA